MSQFESHELHSELLAIRETATQFIVGYVNKNIDTHEWFWFIRDGKSIGYSTIQEAIESLIRTYTTSKFDRMAAKAGTLNHPEYTKR